MQLRAWQSELRNMPAIKGLAEQVDLTERFIVLQAIVMLDRYGPKYFEDQSPANNPLDISDLADVKDDTTRQTLGKIHWDPALRRINCWYDRLESVLRTEDYSKRKEQFTQLLKDLQVPKSEIAFGKLSKALATKSKAAENKASESKIEAAELSEKFGDGLAFLLIPAAKVLYKSVDRREQVSRNLEVAFALALYQREQGRYPKTLDELTPKYLPKIPQDLFTGKALDYRTQDNGYVLSSAGPNGDDGPRIEMPLPKMKKE
ncbi:MAG: hypothetical protein HY040_20155 [Planctomycetes bacterium]|nr:hypothetical protein [Planctomycetota bacterium]